VLDYRSILDGQNLNRIIQAAGIQEENKMPMNIPLPGVPGESFLKGLDTGSTLFTRMMAPILHREQQARQWQQHQDTLAQHKADQARLAGQHAQNYSLQLAAQKRLEQRAADLHQKAMRENDPRYKMEELKAIMEYVKGGGLGGATAGPKEEEDSRSYMPSIGQNFGQEQSYIPSLPEQFGQEESYINPIEMQQEGPQSFMPSLNQPFGQEQSFVPSAMKPFVGASNVPSIGGHIGNQQSMIPQIGMQQIGGEDEIPQLMTGKEPTGAGKFDKLEEQILNGWLKKNYGVDLNQLTPEQKAAAQRDMFVFKEQYKAEHPHASASGITPADRAADRALRRDQLEAKISHYKFLEKTASPEAKIDLQKKRNDLEVVKKQMIDENKVGLEYKKSLNKEQAKQYADMEKQGIEGIKSQPLYNELKDVVSSPLFEEIRQHPYAGHYELEYYKRSPDKAKSALANRFELVTNELIASTAKQLNVRFTNKDLELAQRMKINSKDSLNGARAKAEALIFLHEIGQKRVDKALELAEDGKMTPYAAFKQADKEIDGDAIRKSLSEQISGSKRKTSHEEVKEINGKHYKKIDGEWHEI
jgi:hypothetical protein